MLVTVVLVFLVCHSVKLIINGYEVYYLMSDNFAGTDAAAGANATAAPSSDATAATEAYDEDGYLELGSGDGDGDGGSGQVTFHF